MLSWLRGNPIRDVPILLRDRRESRRRAASRRKFNGVLLEVVGRRRGKRLLRAERRRFRRTWGYRDFGY